MMCSARTTEYVLTRSSMSRRGGRRPWRIPLTLLLEREAELAALASALERGGCVLVRGPAGIGKSTLLAAARETASVPVFGAMGSELEREFAFGAVRQLF